MQRRYDDDDDDDDDDDVQSEMAGDEQREERESASKGDTERFNGEYYEGGYLAGVGRNPALDICPAMGRAACVKRGNFSERILFENTGSRSPSNTEYHY
jgi:hypothetical protein